MEELICTAPGRNCNKNGPNSIVASCELRRLRFACALCMLSGTISTLAPRPGDSEDDAAASGCGGSKSDGGVSDGLGNCGGGGADGTGNTGCDSDGVGKGGSGVAAGYDGASDAGETQGVAGNIKAGTGGKACAGKGCSGGAGLGNGFNNVCASGAGRPKGGAGKASGTAGSACARPPVSPPGILHVMYLPTQLNNQMLRQVGNGKW